MVQRFDHVTFVVRDMEEAVRFFGLLGFQVDIDVTIAGGVIAQYMGIEGIEARHVTLVLADSTVRSGNPISEIPSPRPHPRPAYQ